MWMEIEDGSTWPKRGDLMQTAIGTRKQRTWFILRAVPMRTEKLRYRIWRARWWEIDPDLRMRLYRSAERNRGQTTWYAHPQKRNPRPRKKRMDFEDFMKRKVTAE